MTPVGDSHDVEPRANWRTLRVSSWEELSKILSAPLDGTKFVSDAWLFRGQAKSDWALSTRIDRALRGPPAGGERLIRECEPLILGEFARHAHRAFPRDQLQVTRTPLDWLALMQHHGAPTRLLDWTQSPYVAAYFAVEEAHEIDGAIWAVNLTAYEKDQTNGFPGDEAGQQSWLANQGPSVVAFVQPRHPSDRMAAQQGWFSVCSAVDRRHDEIITARLTTTDPAPALKIVVAECCKREVLYYLDRMGITGLTLFPGADGLGRSVRDMTQALRFTAQQGYGRQYFEIGQRMDLTRSGGNSSG